MTSWTVACQAPLTVEFSSQEYWSGLPFPSSGDLPDPGIEPGSPAFQADSLPPEPAGSKEYLYESYILNFLPFQCFDILEPFWSWTTAPLRVSKVLEIVKTRGISTFHMQTNQSRAYSSIRLSHSHRPLFLCLNHSRASTRQLETVPIPRGHWNYSASQSLPISSSTNHNKLHFSRVPFASNQHWYFPTAMVSHSPLLLGTVTVKSFHKKSSPDQLDSSFLNNNKIYILKSHSLVSPASYGFSLSRTSGLKIGLRKSKRSCWSPTDKMSVYSRSQLRWPRVLEAEPSWARIPHTWASKRAMLSVFSSQIQAPPGGKSNLWKPGIWHQTFWGPTVILWKCCIQMIHWYNPVIYLEESRKVKSLSCVWLFATPWTA